jgi:hypothetical protein
MSLRTAGLVALSLPLLAGCVTTLESKRAIDGAEGLTYALPIPILKVTPKGDGTMAVEVLYIPDPANTYTVQAHSYLGGYTFQVKTNQGLLDTVTFSPDGTAVAQQAIESYAEVQKAKIEAHSKADEDAAKTAADKAKAAADQAKAIQDAQAALDVAIAKRDKLKELGAKDDAVIAGELAVVEAEQKLRVLQAVAAVASADAASNKASNNAKTFDEAAGPVFYRLEPDKTKPGKVNLVDAIQIMQRSAKPVAPGPPPPALAYEIVGSPVIRPGKDGLTFRLRINRKFDSVDTATIKLTDDASGATLKAPKVVKADDGYLLVVLADTTPKSEYHLDFVLLLDRDKGIHGHGNPVAFEVRGKAPK